MPLFIDIHQYVEGLTTEAVSGAQAVDWKVQEKYGMEYPKYWFDKSTGKIVCLEKAPGEEDGKVVRREAHG